MKPIDPKLIDKIVHLYTKKGLTIYQIRDQVGRSHEWVRQRLLKRGVTFKDGAHHKHAARRRVEKLAEKNRLAAERAKRRGMSEAQYQSLPGAFITGFRSFQNAARYFAELPFRLNLAEYVELWKRSGKWEKRGRGKGGYVLCRIDRTKGFYASNLQVMSVVERAQRIFGVHPRPRSWVNKALKARGISNNRQRKGGSSAP